MRFKLYENLPYRAARTFVEAGHDADTVYDEDLAGKPDEVVLLDSPGAHGAGARRARWFDYGEECHMGAVASNVRS